RRRATNPGRRGVSAPRRPCPQARECGGAVRTILVVDDEPRIVQIARDYLERGGFRVVTAGDGRSALSLVRSAKPDLVVLDLALPGLDGLDVTRTVRRDSEVPII